MPLRAWPAGLLFLIACAPSVPRPATKPAQPDAGVDLAPTPPGPADARSDTRPPPAPGSDARGDTQADLRNDVSVGDSHGADVSRADVSRAETSVDVADDARPDDDGAVDGPTGVAPNAGDLIIDELLINPAGTDTNREWIEIVNVSPSMLDLHLLHVADAASDVAVDAGLLAPGGILVLGQSLDETKNGGAPISFSFGNVVSLNNGGDSISICLGPCAAGVVLDQIVWSVDLGAAYDGHAAIVGSAPGVFCPADQPFGTAGSFGSPGAPNPPCGGD